MLFGEKNNPCGPKHDAVQQKRLNIIKMRQDQNNVQQTCIRSTWADALRLEHQRMYFIYAPGEDVKHWRRVRITYLLTCLT